MKLLWDVEGAEFELELAVKQHVTCHRQFSSAAYQGAAFPIGSHKPRQLYSHLLPICTVMGISFHLANYFSRLGLGY